MKPTTREWVNKAENDFKVAAQILRRRKDVVADAACFHCQQCIEMLAFIANGADKTAAGSRC